MRNQEKEQLPTLEALQAEKKRLAANEAAKRPKVLILFVRSCSFVR